MLSLLSHFVFRLLSRAANTTQDTTSASVDEAAGGGSTLGSGALQQPQPLLVHCLLLMTH